MSSPNTFDPVAIAIEICNKDIFKLEVFSGIYSHQDTPEDRKRSWDEKVETVTGSLLEDYPNLEMSEQEAVIGAVFTIAFKMLTWIEFYIGTFGFSRDFCVEFLDSALFTREGIIDSRRVETKMSEKTPTNLQRFQLASFYCQWMAIPGLFNNLSIEDKELVYNANEPELVRQPDIIKFWSYHTMGELDKLKGDDILDQFRLKTAITSGSQLAVNYCMERTRSRQSCLTDIAVSIFRHRVHREIKSDEHMNIVNDWIVFRDKTYNCAEESWVPDNFFADIFYSLISAMSQSQKLDFWRQVFSVKFILSDRRIKHIVYVKVFECFLCWPYQEMFLEFWKTSWPRLSLSVFSLLLLNIIKRIEPGPGHFWYGEEKFYDYRKFLMDLWIDSPKDAKMRLFQEDYANNILELFKSLYNLKSFSERDRRNIKAIIESATENEGFPYMISDSGFKFAIMLLDSKRVDLFDELVSSCFITPEKVRVYKLKVILLKSKKKCLEFVRNKKWNEAEESLKWSEYELSHEDMLAIKNILISCKAGVKTCIALWKSDPDLADQFVRWCIPAEEVLCFKHRLILGEIGQKETRELCIANTETADNFVSWCLPPELHASFKDLLMYQVGSICMCTKYVLKDDTPELADKLIQWCLPEEKRKEYKKWLGHNKIEVFPTFKSNFNVTENCTDDEFPDQLFNWEPAKKMFSWCFALNHKREETVASDAEEKVFFSDPEGTKDIATDPKGTKDIATDPEGTKDIATDPEGTKDIATDPEGTKDIATDPEGTKDIASDPEREKTQASDSGEEKTQAFDIEEGMIIVSDTEGEKMNSEETETIASGPEGEKNRAPEPEGENVAIDPEEEMKFKRAFLKKSRREIIYKCIESNNWNVADRFLSWLNLDQIDLRTVKTEQICSDTETGDLLTDLLSREKTDPKFAETGGKQRTIERFIHWFLVDDVSIVKVFIMRLNRYSDDSIVQNIIDKLKQRDDIEAIKELLMIY